VAQTLTSILTHIVFSIKERRNMIAPEIDAELFAYMGGICKNMGSPLLAASGTENHVHLLISLSKNTALSSLMLDLKRDSSLWIKTKSRQFSDFHWQDGYGAFSIGQSQRQALVDYISRQKEHHARVSFEEELIGLAERYGIEYDPKYLWA
jgi:REP element-mobilizing transposase RayT